MKLDILLNGDVVDALSIITHADDAYDRGVALCSKLKELIPKFTLHFGNKFFMKRNLLT